MNFSWSAYARDSMEAISRTFEDESVLQDAGELLSDALSNGNTIFFAGNGGSSADSQHLAAELVGRFRDERRPLSAVSLTADTSILTALGNDYGFENVFARQVEGLARRGDVLVVMTTSGRSPNILKALSQARKQNVKTIALTGSFSDLVSEYCEHVIKVPVDVTSHIQEAHIAIGHALCSFIDAHLRINSID